MTLRPMARVTEAQDPVRADGHRRLLRAVPALAVHGTENLLSSDCQWSVEYIAHREKI